MMFAATPQHTRSSMRLRLASSTPAANAGKLFAILALMICAAAFIGTLLEPAIARIFVAALINLVLVLGLYVFSGTSGVMSFGQAAYALLGAYVGGILAMPPAQRELLLPNLPGWVQGLEAPQILLPAIAGIMAAIVALPLGLVVSRLSGVVGSIGTFAILVVANEVASNMDQVNGAAGVSGVPVTTTIGNALIWALVVLAAAVGFKYSKTGLLLRSSRADSFAALASGVNIHRGRHIAYVLSAAVSAIAGALYAQFVGSFTPDSFFLSMTMLTIAMLVVGGSGSVTGAVVGCVLVTVIYQLLQSAEAATGATTFGRVTGLAEMGLALALLLALILRPIGVTAGKELTEMRRRRKAGA